MPVTPKIIDPVYHPLDPRTAAPVTPAQRSQLEGVTPYQSTYWSDFRARLGYMRESAFIEDAIIERERASENFRRRNLVGALSFARGVGALAAYGTGFAVTRGIGGMAVGIGLDSVLGGLWKVSGLRSVQESLKTRAFVDDIGQIVARGTGASISGHGFAKSEQGDLASFLNDAAKRFDVSIEDIKTDIVESINAGVFNNVTTVEDFKRQFGQLKKNVSEIIKVLGTSQKEALEMMSELNQSGITKGAITGELQNAVTWSRRTGLSVERFISAGVATAQSFQGTGIPGDVGSRLGQMNLGVVQMGIQSGDISQNVAFQLGGKPENVAFAMTRQQMQFLNSPMGNRLMMAAMTPGGGVDPTKFLSLATGDWDEIQRLSSTNMLGSGYANFMNNQEAIKSQLISTLGSNINTAIATSIYGYAGERGVDPQLFATQIAGFTNTTWDLFQGAISAAPPPGGTLQERRVASIANMEATRAWMRAGGLGDKLMYHFGALGSAVSYPFAEVGDLVSRGIDRFTTDDVILTREDRDIALRALARPGAAPLGAAGYGGNVWRDKLFGIDNTEIINELIDQERVSSTIKRGLGDVYTEPAVRTAIRNKLGNVMLLQGIGDKRLQRKILQEILPTVAGYENFVMGEDVGITGFTSYVIQDITALDELLSDQNQIARMALEYELTDTDKRKTVETIGGQDVGELRRKVLEQLGTGGPKGYWVRFQYGIKSEYQKFASVMEMAGLSMEDINAGDKQANVNAIMDMMGSSRFGISGKKMKEVSLLSTQGKIDSYADVREAGLNAFTTKLDEIKGVNFNKGARNYLQKPETMVLLGEISDMYRSGAPTSKIRAKMNEVVVGAPAGAAMREVGQMFEPGSAEEFFGILDEMYKPDPIRKISEWEQYAVWGEGLKTIIGAPKMDTDKIRKALKDLDIFSRKEIRGMSEERLQQIGSMISRPGIGLVRGAEPGVSPALAESQAALNIALALAMQALYQRMDERKERRAIFSIF